MLRRLRKGYLYVYYSGDNWDKYAVQANRRMVKMQGDMVHAEGIGDAACVRLNSLADTALLIVDPQAHPTFWVAFSDAPWTSNVRKMVQKNPAQYMKQVVVSGEKNLVGIGGANVIQGTVLGFQKKPLLETHDQEAYPRGSMLSADDNYCVRKSRAISDRCFIGEHKGRWGKPYLPLEWTKDEAPPASERNPYQTSVMGPKDAGGRRKAAWIIGVVSGLCISIGIYLYSLGAMVLIGR